MKAGGGGKGSTAHSRGQVSLLPSVDVGGLSAERSFPSNRRTVLSLSILVGARLSGVDHGVLVQLAAPGWGAVPGLPFLSSSVRKMVERLGRCRARIPTAAAHDRLLG